MPRYYCEYCDVFLAHDALSVRRLHNSGVKHKGNVRSYYERFLKNTQDEEEFDDKEGTNSQVNNGVTGVYDRSETVVPVGEQLTEGTLQLARMHGLKLPEYGSTKTLPSSKLMNPALNKEFTHGDKDISQPIGTITSLAQMKSAPASHTAPHRAVPQQDTQLRIQHSQQGLSQQETSKITQQSIQHGAQRIQASQSQSGGKPTPGLTTGPPPPRSSRLTLPPSVPARPTTVPPPPIGNAIRSVPSQAKPRPPSMIDNTPVPVPPPIALATTSSRVVPPPLPTHTTSATAPPTIGRVPPPAPTVSRPPQAPPVPTAPPAPSVGVAPPPPIPTSTKKTIPPAPKS